MGAPAGDTSKARLQLASAIYFVTYYTDAAKNKEEVHQHLKELHEGKKNKAVWEFMDNRKKEYDEKNAIGDLFDYECGKEEEKKEEKKEEEKEEEGDTSKTKFERFKHFLAYSRRLKDKSSVRAMHRILSFPWIACPVYLKKLKS